MHSLQKEFLPLTNQLGKIFENFQNIFAPSSGRRRERRFFRVFIKIFPPLLNVKNREKFA